MFEHEDSYVGYHIIYNDNKYYVFGDDETNLYMYKYKTYNDPTIPGFHHDGLVYKFDFENPVVIDKRRSTYEIHHYYIGFANEEVLGLKDRLNIRDYDKLKKKDNIEYELGDVLSVKKRNANIICIWHDNGTVYYIKSEHFIRSNKIHSIPDDKINKNTGKLNDEEISALLIALESNLKNGNVIYSDALLEELKIQTKKYK